MANDDFKIKIGAELDKSAGKQIQDGINKVPIKPIEIPFKIDLKNSKEIEKEMNRIVSKLTNGKGSLASYKIDTSTVFDKDLGKRVEKLNGATIKYKNALGEVISEQYKFNQIGSKTDKKGQEEAIMGWSKAMGSYSQNTEKATKSQNQLVLKQKELAEQMKLLQIQSDKSGTVLNQENIKGFNTANTNNNIAEMTHYLKLAKTEYSQLNAMMEKDLPITGLENMKNNIGSMPINIQNVETSFKKLLTQPDELRVRIDKLKGSYETLDAFKGSEADKVKQYNLLKTEINGVTKEVQSLIKVQQQEVTVSEKNQFSNQISSYLRENTKLPKETVAELQKLQSQIKSVDRTNLNTLKKNFRELTSETKALGLTGKNTFDKFKSDLANFTTFLGAGTVIMSGINSVRQMISTVTELDKSLVNLQMATGYSNEETKKLLDTYIDLGQELGATGTEVANAADVWLRQGKSIAETNTLIRDSMILSKIGQIDSAQATTYLTSAMKGYKVEASGVLEIIDKLSAVDLNSATSVSGLAEGMSRVANLADQAGVSMDKLLSYLAIVGEVTQKDMSQIGTSFQTMFSRMGNIKIGNFVDDETGESLSDTESVLNKLGIKLRDTENTFRNFGDVLDEIGGKWGSYSDVEKNAIGVAISGVRNRENFTVLMENYSKSLDYAKISANSAGTALEKFSAYEESVEAKTKKVQASLQELATDTLNSGVVKGFLDASNVVVNFTDDVGLLNVAFLSLIGVIGTKTGFFKTFAYEIGNIMMAQTGWTASTYAQAYAQVGLTGAIKATGTALKTFMATSLGGTLITFTALAVTIKGLSVLYDKLNVTAEELAEAHEKSVSKVNELTSAYDGLSSSLKDLESQQVSVREELEKLYDLRENQTITQAEEDRLQQLEDINTKLEKQIEYENTLINIKSGEAEKAAVSTLAEKSQSSIFTTSDGMGGTTSAYLTDSDKIEENTIQIKALNQEIQNYNDAISGIKLPEEQQERYNKQIEYYKTALEDGLITQDEYNSKVEAINNLLSGNLTFEQYSKTIEELKNKQSDYISENEGLITTVQGLNDSIVSTSGANYDLKISNQDIIDSAKEEAVSFNSLIGAVDSTTSSTDNLVESANKVSVALSKILSDETLSKSVDSFQSDMEIIGESLSKISSLSSSDIVDLMQRFSDFNWESYGVNGVKGVGDLEGALNGLAISLRGNLDDTLKSNDAISDMYQETLKASIGVSDLATVTDAANQKTKLSGEQVEFLSSKYSGLSDMLVQTTDGWYLEEGAIGLVETAITDLKDAYVLAQTEMSSMLQDESYKRLQAMGIELTAMTSMGSLYNLIGTRSSSDEETQKLLDFAKEWFKLKDSMADVFSGVPDSGKSSSTTKSSKKETDPIKEAFDLEKDTLDHQLAMEEITQEQYLNGLEKLNEKYFGKRKDKYLEDYRQYEEEVYKGRKEIAEDAADKAEKDEEKRMQKRADAINSVIDAYEKSISGIEDYASSQEDGSQGQLSAYSEGIKTATDELKYLQKEVDKLNKLYAEGKIDEDDYFEQLTNLQDSMSDAKSVIESFQDKIADSVMDNLETITDYIEETHEKRLDQLDDEKEAYNDIVDAQKEALQIEKDRHDYEKSIADKTEEIADIQTRMADLKKAASTGDREAQAELDKLNADLEEKQEDLDETQYDHKIDLAEDALDKEADKYSDIIDSKISEENRLYEDKLSNITALFNKEKELIANAASYTAEEFAKAFSDINAQLETYGFSSTDEYKNSVISSQANVANTKSSINSILGTPSDKNSSQDQSDMSELNKYLTSKGYKRIYRKQMIELAQALGLYDIDDINELGSNQLGEANKNRILIELKKLLGNSTFATGGLVGTAVKSLGEDGVALLKRDELVFNQVDSKIFRSDFIPMMKDFVSQFKFQTPKMPEFINRNSSPSISITIPISGNATPSTVSALNTASNNIVKQIMSEVRKL